MPDILSFSRLVSRAPQHLKLRTYLCANPKSDGPLASEKRFGASVKVARRAYAAFVAKGIAAAGRRPDLVGGGLLRWVVAWFAWCKITLLTISRGTPARDAKVAACLRRSWGFCLIPTSLPVLATTPWQLHTISGIPGLLYLRVLIGYPLRRVTYDDGISHKEEVVQVEEKSLKKELFILPANYRKVAFGEVFK